MSPEYLGETPVDLTTHPIYSTYGASDWAMLFVEGYGQIDGDHHKAWVLDQVSRLLKGAPVTVKHARWSDGQWDDRVEVGEPSAEYWAWREKMLGRNEAGEPQYSYYEGIAP